MGYIDYSYWNNANVNRSAFIFKSEKSIRSTSRRDKMYAREVMNVLRTWYNKPIITISQVINSSFKMLFELAYKTQHGWNLEIYPIGKNIDGEFSKYHGGMFNVKLKDSFGYEYMDIRCYYSHDVMRKVLLALEKRFRKYNSDRIINIPCVAGSAVLFTRKGWFIYSKHDDDYIEDRKCFSFMVSPAGIFDLPLLSYPVGWLCSILVMLSRSGSTYFKYLYDIERCEPEDIIE